MPISDVPKQPLYSEVRKVAEKVQDAADEATKVAADRKKQAEDLRSATDASNRRKGESSKQK